jgi:hypothetical protein
MTKKRREIMICSDCQGEGVTPLWIAGSFEEQETCERCNGSGRVVVLTSISKEPFRENSIFREKVYAKAEPLLIGDNIMLKEVNQDE